MLAALAWAAPVLADESARDRLIGLATVEVIHDLCDFELPDAREAAITAIQRKLLDDGDVTGSDITDVHDELAAAFARQVPEGLCRKDGPGEVLYRHDLEAIGAP